MLSPLAPLLPPVTRFLLEEVCLGSFVGAASAATAVSFTATDLATEAHNQGVTGLLYQWARHNAGNPIANELIKLLAPQLQTNTLHALRLINDTVRVVEALKAAGVDALVLKGPLLSKRFYGDYGIRNAGDVDILVAEENVVRADKLLRDAGHRRTKPERELTGRRLKLYLDTQHEFGYEPPSGPGLVELHWRFADARVLSPQKFSALWERAETMVTGSRPLRVLSAADTFVQLATHGATDGWSALKWISDLPRVYAALNEVDRKALNEAARQPDTGRLLQLALSLVHGDCAHFPLRIAAAGEPMGAVEQLRAFINGYRYLYSLVDTGRARCALTNANLITPKDFDALQLPDPLTPLLRWLAQLRRGFRRLLLLS